MIETNAGQLNRTRNSAFFLFCVACVLFFNLGGRSIENNDYPHFAEIGREILETGDWIIMHSGGDMYIDKPPLHTIFIALSDKAFGVNAFAGRFPAALFAFFGVAATLLFGLRMDKGRWQTGVYAALLLLSSYGFFFLARRFRNDIEYAMLFSLALFSFYEGYEALESRRKWVFYGLFWFAMGLATLIKGPAALLPLLIIIVFLLMTKSWSRVGGKIFFACFAMFFVVVAPYLVLLVSHKDFAQFAEMMRNHTIMKRNEGLFYYIPVFFAKFFPGSFLLLPCLPLFWKKRREIAAHPKILFLMIWAGLYLVLIHFIKAKVYRYLLPVFPPLALITAWVIVQVLPVERWAPYVKRFWKIPAALVCLGFPIAICVKFGLSWQALVLAVAALGMLAVAGGKMRDGVVLLCSLCVACMLFIDVLHTARNSEVSTNKKLYAMLQEKQIKDNELIIYKTTGRMRYLLCFYFNKLIHPEIEDKLTPQQGIRAVITDPVNVGDVTAVFGQPSEQRMVKGHHGEESEGDHAVLFYGGGSSPRPPGV
ncbi:MAG: glycosyltransferase family 39 protein [Proteobacteria bacterium]|nr:glycosyltransferase family 39 protein [Pseudomonadota bacterium]